MEKRDFNFINFSMGKTLVNIQYHTEIENPKIVKNGVS